MSDMLLHVPYFRQKYTYTCGPASLRMVFAYFGNRIPREDIYNQTGVNPKTGTSHRMMIATARVFGFRVVEKSRASLRDLSHALENKMPVNINYIETSHEIGHYAVVIGMENGRVILNDPWNGRRLALPEKELIKRWKNSDGRSIRWMMIMYPKRSPKQASFER